MRRGFRAYWLKCFSVEDNVTSASVPVALTLSASHVGSSTCNSVINVSNVITHSSQQLTAFAYKSCCATTCKPQISTSKSGNARQTPSLSYTATHNADIIITHSEDNNSDGLTPCCLMPGNHPPPSTLHHLL